MTSHIAAKKIKQLQQKKFRKETGKFIVEGVKNVQELLSSDYRVEHVYATKEFATTHAKLLAAKDIRPQIVEASELAAFGTLEHNDGALAVAIQKSAALPKSFSGITLVLDDIRDPGNLGTMIRIADWYGVTSIVLSPSCVDWYNPKVIAATMGSFTRVAGYYTELPAFLKSVKMPIIGTFLGGASAHTFAFPKDGMLVIGSESHGISREVEKSVTDKVTIPSFGGGAESLNAAVACAVMLDRWKGS